MAYFIDIYSPETHAAFSNTDKSTSGYHIKRKGDAEGVKPGDKFICYVTKLSRWVGVMEVASDLYIDDKPFLTDEIDPYVVRFKVRTSVFLPLDQSIPMSDPNVWSHLSFTKDLPKGSGKWSIKVRKTLTKLSDEDGAFLEQLLTQQSANPVTFDINESDRKKLKTLTVKTQDSKQVAVSIPENEETQSAGSTQIPEKEQGTTRDSIKIQALLAQIGERMEMKIWIPRSDKQRVLENWSPQSACLLDQLPLNYDDATLKTIENIDVLWIKGRSIVRAFEVEHTTSIYSGILRMADLMALQPNLNIKAHIVAPMERREKVLVEITRPVFTFLEKGPLSESCTFISYEAVHELSREKRLEYMNDSVLEDFEESAGEAEV